MSKSDNRAHDEEDTETMTNMPLNSEEPNMITDINTKKKRINDENKKTINYIG